MLYDARSRVAKRGKDNHPAEERARLDMGGLGGGRSVCRDGTIGGSQGVAIIIDCPDAPNPPSSSVLPHYLRAADLEPENLVLMVIVNVGGFLEAMGTVFTNVDPGARSILQFVRSMEEAEALVSKVQASPASAAG